jgi:Leucine-rich repeat (LRR) protein
MNSHNITFEELTIRALSICKLDADTKYNLSHTNKTYNQLWQLSPHTFDMSTNQLVMFPAQLGPSQKLQTLDRTNNQLVTIPSQFGVTKKF